MSEHPPSDNSDNFVDNLINIDNSEEVVFVGINEGIATVTCSSSKDDLLAMFDPLPDVIENHEASSEALLNEPEAVFLSDDHSSLHETSNTVHEHFNDSDDSISSPDPLN